MSERAVHLLPRPRELRGRDGSLGPGTLRFSADGPPAAMIRPAVEYLTDRLAIRSRGASAQQDATVEIRFELAEALPSEAYELDIGATRVRIRAAGRRGLLYGAATLRQWLEIHQRSDETTSIPCVAIRDRPDFSRRGVMLDISRNKVPRMEQLLRLVDRLVELKINELQLYMEHTFAYPDHEEVWRQAGALSADEIQQLDGYCRLRCIELVPNQNSFGHFHRWLMHPRYRDLAECPEGVRHPFSDRVEPFSLCPTDPASLELLRDIYGKLLPNFTSGRFHVGFDETFEIGQGRSRKACAEVGVGRVYLDFLKKVRRLAGEHHRRLQIWADMLLEHRELLAEVPDDVVLCAWGYEAGHPFREDCAVLRSTGSDVYVCPGTSSWSSFAGRTQNALVNLGEAASAGIATGADGYLITDWGDRGHLQPLSVSYLGFTAGAAFAWNRSGASRLGTEEWGQAIDRWMLDSPGCGLGEAALELGGAHALTGASQKNGTALFHLLMSPDGELDHPRYKGLSRQGLAAASDSIRSTSKTLRDFATADLESRRTRDELIWIADTLDLSCRLGAARLESPTAAFRELPENIQSEIRGSLGHLAERRRELWIERNRPEGVEDSLRLFTRCLSPSGRA